MKRIICVGNRFAAHDDAGPRVFDVLCCERWPEGVEVIDGGLLGLDLLRVIDGAERVVIVDSVSGYGAPGHVEVMSREQAAATASGAYDHAAGLTYLLRVLPSVCEAPQPEVVVIGVEGPATDEVVARAAALSKRALMGGDGVMGREDLRGSA